MLAVQLVVDLWQVSHDAVVAIWPADLPPAMLPLWQLAHCPVTITWLWFQLLGTQPVVLWQATQLAVPVGMWMGVLPVAVLPLWQLAQLVAAVKVLWSTRVPAVQLAVDLWQFSQAVALAWRALAGLPTAGAKPPLWQAAHCATTEKLACRRAGNEPLNPARWQLSQLALPMPDTAVLGT